MISNPVLRHDASPVPPCTHHTYPNVALSTLGRQEVLGHGSDASWAFQVLSRSTMRPWTKTMLQMKKETKFVRRTLCNFLSEVGVKGICFTYSTTAFAGWFNSLVSDGKAVFAVGYEVGHEPAAPVNTAFPPLERHAATKWEASDGGDGRSLKTVALSLGNRGRSAPRSCSRFR